MSMNAVPILMSLATHSSRNTQARIHEVVTVIQQSMQLSMSPLTTAEPPRVHLACHMQFSQVHLSSVDEATVADLVRILQSPDEINLRDRIHWSFNIICYDFGAQLFLQRPKLLQVSNISKVILNLDTPGFFAIGSVVHARIH